MQVKGKLLALVIAAVMVISLGAVAFANEKEATPTISVTSATAQPGGIVSLTAEVQNNPGINTFTLGFNYNTDALELVDVQKDPNLPGMMEYSKKAVWLNGKDTTYCGSILHLTFRVKAGAAAGEYPVSVTIQKAADICNYNEESISFSFASGSIQVVAVACDLNGDGKTDASDLRLLARHISGIETITDETKLDPADVNADGVISAADLTALAKLLNN